MAALKTLLVRLFCSVAILATISFAANIDRFHATAGTGTIASHVFNQISVSQWVKLDISNGAVVKTYNEVSRDQWSVYLLSTTEDENIYIDYRTKSIKNRAGSNTKLFDIIPTKKYSEMTHQQLLTSKVNGRNVYHAVVGTASGVKIMALQKAGPKKWVSLNLVDGRREFVDTFEEVIRDQWSVYFRRPLNYYTGVDLWTKFYKLGWNKTPIMSVLEFSG